MTGEPEFQPEDSPWDTDFTGKLGKQPLSLSPLPPFRCSDNNPNGRRRPLKEHKFRDTPLKTCYTEGRGNNATVNYHTPA